MSAQIFASSYGSPLALNAAVLPTVARAAQLATANWGTSIVQPSFFCVPSQEPKMAYEPEPRSGVRRSRPGAAMPIVILLVGLAAVGTLIFTLRSPNVEREATGGQSARPGAVSK